jgi:glutamate racemase
MPIKRSTTQWKYTHEYEVIDSARAEIRALDAYLHTHPQLNQTAARSRLVLVLRELNDIENIARHMLGYDKGGPVNDNITTTERV